MMYHKQFSISQPCAGGLSKEIFSWPHGLMQPVGCHLSEFRMCFDRSVYQSYDITDLNSVSKFRLNFRFCFIIYP
jgi:hypothetical protein